MVYNQQFESARLSDLASWLPEFADRIKSIQSRLWDLLPLIRNHVYQTEQVLWFAFRENSRDCCHCQFLFGYGCVLYAIQCLKCLRGRSQKGLGPHPTLNAPFNDVQPVW